jgi:hypothetical protein
VVKVLPGDDKVVNEMKQLVCLGPIAVRIEDLIVWLVHATQGDGENGGIASSTKQYIRFGSSPRGRRR